MAVADDQHLLVLNKYEHLLFKNHASVARSLSIEEFSTIASPFAKIKYNRGLSVFIVIPVQTSEPLPPVSHTDHAQRVVDLAASLGVEER